MIEYHTILILSMCRLLLACVVVFTIMPTLLFPPFPSKNVMERLFATSMLMACLTMVVMHVFAFLKLNDTIAAFIITLWLIAFKWWNTYRRQNVGFVMIKSVLLRWIEIMARPSTIKLLGTSLQDFGKRNIITRITFAAIFLSIIVTAVYLRIGPIWNHPAPLSTEYYETLEHVKHLQINEMYVSESRIPIGMSIIINALCTASQVNPTLAVHFFGIISAVLVCGSIFFSVYTATGSNIEATLGCILFAIAYELFPGSVNHQTEADSLTLAVAFLIPSLTVFIIFVSNGGRARLLASISGLIATASINLFAGGIGVAAAIIILCSSFLVLPFLNRLRTKLFVWHFIFTCAVGAALIMGWWYMFNDEQIQTLLNIIFYDEHFNRFVLTDNLHISSFLAMSAGIFVLLIAASMIPSARNQWHLHLIGWGCTGILLIVLSTPAMIGLDNIIPVSQVVFLLSIVTALAIGMCACVLLDAVVAAFSLTTVSASTRQWIRTASGTVLIAIALGACHGHPATARMTAEPDGFVKSLYEIERNFIPYQWTIVAHRGILLAGMNRGRFLDYDFFNARYDPLTYQHGTPGAIPTALVFIFIEKNTNVTGISSELVPLNRDAMARTMTWCDTYRKTHDDMTIFFSDETIIIYELRDPKVPSLRI